MFVTQINNLNRVLHSITRLSFIDFQHSTMSSDLSYDIIVQIIDNIGETNDLNLIKELALVSHSFNQICAKHLFASLPS